MSLRTIALSLTVSGLLVACSGDFEAKQCEPKGKNLLIDPGFSTVLSPRAQRKWHASEHRAGKSFEYEVNGNELLIRKTGTEPWFVMTQSLTGDKISGKTVLFSAEVKLDLRKPEVNHNFKVGGGLTLTATAKGKPVIRSTLEHEPHMGTTKGWQQVQVMVDLPKKTESVRLGFLHQADGELMIRKPSLRRLPDSDCAL